MEERISETLTTFTEGALRVILVIMKQGSDDSALRAQESKEMRKVVSDLRSPHSLLVERALQLFREQPGRRWTVEDLASALGTSRPVLNRHFSAALAKPPLRVLREMRMELAADLLTRSGDGLAAIADAVGYDSEFALSRAFFRHFGTRPGAFRSSQGRGTSAPTLCRAA